MLRNLKCEHQTEIRHCVCVWGGGVTITTRGNGTHISTEGTEQICVVLGLNNNFF